MNQNLTSQVSLMHYILREIFLDFHPQKLVYQFQINIPNLYRLMAIKPLIFCFGLVLVL